jgi:serine/threonine-protein kinase
MRRRRIAHREPPMASTPHNLEQAETLVGRTIGKYRMLGVVGQGGMGCVYEALNTTINKRVAIKCVDHALSKNAEAIARFQREALAASAIESPHIVQIFDAGEADGVPFIVMELLRGQDLGGYITESGRLGLHDALQITGQVLRGLHHAHRAGIVHRDLKPDNVFLAEREDEPFFVKLLDFGVSKIARSNDVPLQTLTRQGTVVGTPFYMSPEQAQAFPDVDGRTDVYSAGAILFECLAGRPPHTGQAYEQVIVNICMKDAPDVRELNDAVSEPVAQVIAKALSRERDDRYDSARAMLDALVDAAPTELRIATPSSSLRKLKAQPSDSGSFRPRYSDPNRDSGERPRSSAPVVSANPFDEPPTERMFRPGTEPSAGHSQTDRSPTSDDRREAAGTSTPPGDGARPGNGASSAPRVVAITPEPDRASPLADTVGLEIGDDEETTIMHTEPPLAAETLPVHRRRWPVALAPGVMLLVGVMLYFRFGATSGADAEADTTVSKVTVEAEPAAPTPTAPSPSAAHSLALGDATPSAEPTTELAETEKADAEDADAKSADVQPAAPSKVHTAATPQQAPTTTKPADAPTAVRPAAPKPATRAKAKASATAAPAPPKPSATPTAEPTLELMEQ